MTRKSLKPQRRYLSYLLRIWRENGEDRPLWRASLERTQDCERLVFASLVDLFSYLEKETKSGLLGPACVEEHSSQPPKTGQ